MYALPVRRRAIDGGARALALVLLAGLAGILAAPAGAPAQAALDQYIPSPKPRGTSGDGGGDATGSVGGGGGGPGGTGSNALPAATVGGGSAGGGEVPGSGYPITTFVAVIAALVAAGLLFRVIWPVIRRRT